MEWMESPLDIESAVALAYGQDSDFPPGIGQLDFFQAGLPIVATKLDSNNLRIELIDIVDIHCPLIYLYHTIQACFISCPHQGHPLSIIPASKLG